jgi:hypothetical protein
MWLGEAADESDIVVNQFPRLKILNWDWTDTKGGKSKDELDTWERLSLAIERFVSRPIVNKFGSSGRLCWPYAHL